MTQSPDTVTLFAGQVSWLSGQWHRSGLPGFPVATGERSSPNTVAGTAAGFTPAFPCQPVLPLFTADPGTLRMAGP